MRQVISLAVGMSLLTGCVYALFLVISWLAVSLTQINPTVGASMIAGSATVLGSVLIASYNARMARERAAEEAHRRIKAEIYTEFMDMVVRLMRNTKSGKSGDEVIPAGFEDFFYNFTAKVTVYGGPGVVKAFGNWRSASKERSSVVSRMDELFRAMREDLGESNRGLEKNELLGLYVLGGQAEIARTTVS